MFIFQAKIIGHYAPLLVSLSHARMSKPVPPWGHQWDSLRRRHLRLDRTRFAHRSAALHWWSSSWKAAHHCNPIQNNCIFMHHGCLSDVFFSAYIFGTFSIMGRRVQSDAQTVLRFRLKKLGGLYLDYASIAYYATSPGWSQGIRKKWFSVAVLQKGMKGEECWSSGHWFLKRHLRMALLFLLE